MNRQLYKALLLNSLSLQQDLSIVARLFKADGDEPEEPQDAQQAGMKPLGQPDWFKPQPSGGPEITPYGEHGIADEMHHHQDGGTIYSHMHAPAKHGPEGIKSKGFFERPEQRHAREAQEAEEAREARFEQLRRKTYSTGEIPDIHESYATRKERLKAAKQARTFTNFEDAEAYLGGKSRRPIPGIRSTEVVRNGDGSIGLKYHDTQVVKYYPDGRIHLDTGGWHTFATKRRINTYSSANISGPIDTNRSKDWVTPDQWVIGGSFKQDPSVPSKWGDPEGGYKHIPGQRFAQNVAVNQWGTPIAYPLSAKPKETYDPYLMIEDPNKPHGMGQKAHTHPYLGNEIGHRHKRLGHDEHDWEHQPFLWKK